MIVDFGEEEHGHQAGRDPEHLLGMEAGVLGVEGGGVNFKDGDGAEQQHHAEQRPVEVAKAEEPPHQGFSSFLTTGWDRPTGWSGRSRGARTGVLLPTQSPDRPTDEDLSFAWIEVPGSAPAGMS